MDTDVLVHAEGILGGIAWQVCKIPGLSGIRWRIRVPVDHLGQTRWKESSGAFYDNAEDHPEGAIAWATASVKEYLTRASTTTGLG